MNKFSFQISLLFVAVATLFSSCDSDELRASVTLSQDYVYFSSKGQTQTISYSGSNISSISASDVPDGWSLNFNRSKKTITVVGPTSTEDFVNSLTPETVTITATSKDDNSGYDYLTLATTNSAIDITDQQANSFLVSSPNTIYTFSAYYKGENEESISPDDIEILWQSSPAPITFSRLVDGNVEFHVAADTSDVDEDEYYDDIIEGNAVIAAYDSSDNIIWSWHIWVSDYSADDSAIELNGVTIMDRNLGANANSVTNTYNILESYGLYYQWGRKDPFIGPYYYNAAGSTDASMVGETSTSVTISYEESTSTVGKESYAIKYPLTFILGVEDSDYDWLYSAHSSTLWTSLKTINDPCPKGWRVASSDVYEGLKVPSLTTEELQYIADDYGWLLSDTSGNSALFMGVGRRGYITGKIQNVNLNESCPAPWAGYYWTVEADHSDETSTAMYFAYDGAEISGNKLTISNYHRANGMQVRCQRND